MVLCDLNGLKQLNNTYGHAAGDAILKVIAGRLQRLSRRHDTVARLGGDEFVLLLRQRPTGGRPMNS